MKNDFADSDPFIFKNTLDPANRKLQSIRFLSICFIVNSLIMFFQVFEKCIRFVLVTGDLKVKRMIYCSIPITETIGTNMSINI